MASQQSKKNNLLTFLWMVGVLCMMLQAARISFAWLSCLTVCTDTIVFDMYFGLTLKADCSEKKFRLLTSICSSYSLWYRTLSDSRCHLFLFYSHRIHTHQRMTFHNIITTFENLSLLALFTVLYMNSLSYSHSPCREPKQHDATTTMLQSQDESIRRRAVNQHILILGLSVKSSL